jgi:cell division protein FtsW
MDYKFKSVTHPHSSWQRFKNHNRLFDFKRGWVDGELLFIILTLVCLGSIIGFSGHYHFSAQRSRAGMDLYYFVTRQLMWTGLGLFAMVFFIFLSLPLLKHITPSLWILTVVLNILPLVQSGNNIRGSSRWLFIGSLSFQPSELAKIVILLYLARILGRNKKEYDHTVSGVLNPALMTAILGFIVYLQNDLSTTLFLFLTTIGIFFVAQVPFRYLFIEIALVVGVGLTAILFTPFRLARIQTWLANSQADVWGIGRQPIMARRAVEAGGFFGTGLGAGTYKLGFISLIQSDYIFAVVAEELGFIGIIFVLGLFMLFMIKAYIISQKCPTRYEQILSVGVGLIITGQALLNITVISGLFPVTGVALPFFSAGGSSIFITLCFCGLLLNLSRGRSIS